MKTPWAAMTRGMMGSSMKTMMMRTGLAGLVLAAGTMAAQAGPIGAACAQSSRAAASTPGLCGCIQYVADQTLRPGDQRRVASFFKNPDKAQDVFMSQKRADDAFWERYKMFGEAAEATCQPQQD